MSHGGGGDTEGVEVNMIPMIDIVIQLITFFLMLVNLDNSNRDQRVRLPIADLAKPTETNIEEALVLNVDHTGRVSVGESAIDVDSPAFRDYIGREAQVARDVMEKFQRRRGVSRTDGQLATVIMIRADKEAEYGKVQRMIGTCQELGFTRFLLRAHPAAKSF